MGKTTKSSSLKKQDAERLIALRKAFGWTQRELAIEFNVSHGAVAMWESSERSVPGAVVKLIEIYEKKIKNKRTV